MTDILLFGFESAAAREELLTVPPAPRNYGPEKAAEWVQKKQREMAIEAAGNPVTATLTYARVTNLEGHNLFQMSSRISNEVSAGLIRWLLGEYGACFSDSLLLSQGDALAKAAERPRSLAMFGFEIDNYLRVAALETLATGQMDVPVRLWHNPPHTFDPYQILLPRKTDRDQLELPSLIKFLADDTVGSMTPDEQIRLLRILIVKGQLLGTRTKPGATHEPAKEGGSNPRWAPSSAGGVASAGEASQ